MIGGFIMVPAAWVPAILVLAIVIWAIERVTGRRSGTKSGGRAANDVLAPLVKTTQKSPRAVVDELQSLPGVGAVTSNEVEHVVAFADTETVLRVAPAPNGEWTVLELVAPRKPVGQFSEAEIATIRRLRVSVTRIATG